MTLFTDGGVKRVCKQCRERYRPRVEDQVYCGRECRMQAKAAEARAQRMLWRKAGRPSETELETN